ncbi:hypothetical protein D9M71_300480 [compost metagenome]
MNFPLFKLGQFAIQVELVEVEVCSRPFATACGQGLLGRRLRCGGRHNGGRYLGSTLLEQLPSGVEHLQAGAATHHAARHAQLVVADAEAGLAMRTLGDETVGHAAIRVMQMTILGALSGGDH